MEDTIFRFASLTKPVVSAAVLRMADLGLLSLDDPVDKYLPFFRPQTADGSRPPILIRQLLTHTSGLSYERVPDDVSRGSDAKPLMPLEENLRRLARAELLFVPGTAWSYGMSIDVLGGVIGAINGNVSNVEAAVAKYVTGPLGMLDTHFFATDPARVAVAYGDAKPVPIRMGEPQLMIAADGHTSMMSPGRLFERSAPQSGGSGMAGTAADFMRLLEALRGDFLKSETRKAAFANQIGAIERPGTNAKFGWFGAVLGGREGGWERQGMIEWGGTWGNSWLLDAATETALVILTNTMWEGVGGRFVKETQEAVFGSVAVRQ
jgi:CubicO group peptidase (beta-lactamase class C family)